MAELPVRDAVAFDRHVFGYDDVANSALGRELRRRVHDVVEPLLRARDCVVDLGCGTGIDAAWLATRVDRVHGFDVSTAMVDAARQRCHDARNVTIDVADAGHLEADERFEPFDLLLANFGVVNCLDATSLRGSLGLLVRPGGHAVVVTMTRWCPIELTVALLTANRSLLGRRHRVARSSSGPDGVVVRYASAHGIAGDLAPDFELVQAESLGLVLPPFEQRRWVEGRPRLLDLLAGADRRLGAIGARLGAGDHHIIVLRRRGS